MSLTRAAALVLVLGLVAGCGDAVMVAEGTPEDLRDVVVAAMDSIRQAIPSQAGCLDGVTVTHDWDLDRRAEYRPESRTVVLRVPATAADLEFSLAHEIAHHLELTCDSHSDLRPDFLEAQGFGQAQAWFEGDSWATTPSELYATAVAQLVTGHPDGQRRLTISDEALAVVRTWAAGR